MNIYHLSRVRLGTPFKSVNGFAFADTLTKTQAHPLGSPAFWLMCQQKGHPLTILKLVLYITVSLPKLWLKVPESRSTVNCIAVCDE